MTTKAWLTPWDSAREARIWEQEYRSVGRYEDAVHCQQIAEELEESEKKATLARLEGKP